MSNNSRRRVVVTGMGAVTPVGCTVEAMWDALIHGRSGVGPVTHFDASQHSSKIAAEVKDFDPLQYLSAKEVDRNDPFVQFAIGAALDAVKDGRGGAVRVRMRAKRMLQSKPRWR